MLPSHVKSLRDGLGDASNCLGRYLWGAEATISLSDVLMGTSLGGRLSQLCGRSVLIATRDQLSAALSLIELDGVARRLTICPSDISYEHFPSIIASAEVDAIVSDNDELRRRGIVVDSHVTANVTLEPAVHSLNSSNTTEWIILTSGTTGAPKLLIHSLSSLTAAIEREKNESRATPAVWGTFYDIRRYGGLQIFLRSVLGNGSLVLSSVDEPLGTFLTRLGSHGVTFVSGTPSHWRRALMSPFAHEIAPRYVRLSGEIADQAILDNLRNFYPKARIGHAYASTEAGVAFEVTDGLEGFPASIIGADGPVELKVEGGALKIRSAGIAEGYLSKEPLPFADAYGFADTADIVQLCGDRYYFLGRRSGVINVGGLKVHPEEVEAAINRHPKVRVSRVRARKNPITGSIVVADVVLREQLSPIDGAEQKAIVTREIIQICQKRLARHKVPTTIYFVPNLDISESGKLARHNA
jgi:acyl-coenzyme A synthetase/AMP-(fatty) acid ligase